MHDYIFYYCVFYYRCGNIDTNKSKRKNIKHKIPFQRHHESSNNTEYFFRRLFWYFSDFKSMTPWTVPYIPVLHISFYQSHVKISCTHLVQSYEIWIQIKHFGACVSLTHWSHEDIDAILQKAFSNAFSWTKIVVFWWKFHWNNLFPRVQLLCRS